VFERCELVTVGADIVHWIPLPITGIDSDNSGEFITDHLLKFCDSCRLVKRRKTN